jgi:hypothetical protein
VQVKINLLLALFERPHARFWQSTILVPAFPFQRSDPKNFLDYLWRQSIFGQRIEHTVKVGECTLDFLRVRNIETSGDNLTVIGTSPTVANI